MAGSLLIGNKNCSIDTILSLMAESAEFDSIFINRVALAEKLDCAWHGNRSIWYKKGEACSLEKILIKWRSRAGNKATLGKLLFALEDLRYQDAANKIRDLFKDQMDSRGNSHYVYDAWSVLESDKLFLSELKNQPNSHLGHLLKEETSRDLFTKYKLGLWLPIIVIICYKMRSWKA